MVERKRAEDRILASLQEKEVLLKEINHRVKNNLQLVSSLLSLQSEGVSDEQAREGFRESQDRVRSLALLHESLYQSEDLARIDFPAYVRRLASDLFRAYEVNTEVVTLHTDVQDVALGLDAAIPCGLIINELVSNSMKHAFSGGRKGDVCVELHSSGQGHVSLVVSDNGIGFPLDLDPPNTESLGLQLVHILTRQLGGTVVLHRGVGTKFEISFSL